MRKMRNTLIIITLMLLLSACAEGNNSEDLSSVYSPKSQSTEISVSISEEEIIEKEEKTVKDAESEANVQVNDSLTSSDIDDESSVVVIIPSTSNDEDGNTSDDTSTESSSNTSSDSSVDYENEEKDFSDYAYVLNVNSNKIHLPSCMSVAKMKASNAKGTNDTLEILISSGYSPCQDCLKDAGQDIIDTPSDDNQTEYHWILNTSSKKIHHLNCKSVSKMKDSNKAESTKSIEELKAEGYETCKNCFK